jgi:hypothetical protein
MKPWPCGLYKPAMAANGGVLCTPTGDRSQGTADTAGTLPTGVHPPRMQRPPRVCWASPAQEMIESRHGRVAGLFEQTCQGWIDSAKAHE